MHNNSMPTSGLAEEAVPLAALGGSMASLRLGHDAAIKRMRDSMVLQGQLTPISAFRKGDLLEVIDGFKRLRSAQQLGWPSIRVSTMQVNSSAAKVALMILNQGDGITELEEAWVVRALYRDDHLTQPQIARLFTRDKSWVSRRLLMAEHLDENVSADVRLGLLCASAAEIIARLPRGNQKALTDLVIKQGLTTHQVQRLVAQVMSLPTSEQSETIKLAAQVPWLSGRSSPAHRGQRVHSPSEWIAIDAAGITRGCVRMQVNLRRQPLNSLSDPTKPVILQTLHRLSDVLQELSETIASAVKGQKGHDDRRAHG